MDYWDNDNNNDDVGGGENGLVDGEEGLEREDELDSSAVVEGGAPGGGREEVGNCDDDVYQNFFDDVDEEIEGGIVYANDDNRFMDLPTPGVFTSFVRSIGQLWG